VKVISSPKLMVLNNHEAQLQVGDQVPIVTQSAVSVVGDNSPVVNTVKLLDTGVILRVTPRANKNGLVLLDIAQEVSDVTPTTTSSIDSPTIRQRKLSSSVAVHDGETVALGGLIRDSRSKTHGGLPVLRRIPLLGSLFGSVDNTRDRTELVVLLTPRVIRSGQEADNAMVELRQEFRALQKILPKRWNARDAKERR
jgi:general secretion pathway protein D